MTTPLYTISELPASSQAALREFDDRYLAGIGAKQAATWSDLGDSIDVDGPMVTFPISSLSLKYLQTEGESRFKTLLEKSFDVKAEEFDVGIEAPLLNILTKTFAYRNWQQGPNRMIIAEGRFKNRGIVSLLESGATTNWVDGVPFFSANHLADLSSAANGTWSNYQSTAKDVASIDNIAAEVTIMEGVLDENGEKFGVMPDTILLPTAKYEKTKNLLAQGQILQIGTGTATGAVASVTNPYQGKFNVVHAPELNATNDWYLIDSSLLASTGLAPWLSMKYVVPSNSSLGLRTWGEESDFCKDTGRIKVSSHIWYGFALAFPHAIRLVRGV